ncbi:MAG: FAD-dependent oxidoreductase, partial [Pricia sp.]|nr:FAD-dependent oxidoreductase [Pricia sp.]
MNNTYDLIVVGGGVLGTFHAYHAINRGFKVALLERDGKPQGATVRNFGQVVPSGMNTKWQAYGRESLRIYKNIQKKFDISVRQEGSIYLASNEEEVQLLEELRDINRRFSYPSELWTKAQCLEKYPGLRDDYVKAGLFFPEEIMIEPRLMIGKLHHYLATKGLNLYLNKNVIECHELTNGVHVHTSDDKSYSASKVLICNGSDFKTLYPQRFAESDMVISKLQMMQTKPQKNYRLPSSVLTGLS